MTTYVLNQKMNGVEIYFDRKPAAQIIADLKAAAWRWHNAKKCWYNKQSESAVALAEQLANSEAAPAELPRNAETPAANIHGVKVGDIFSTCWGWEQTNVYFYEVVAVTAKMATVREIKAKATYTAYMQGHKEPLPGEYKNPKGGKEFFRTRTDKTHAGEPMLINADGNQHRGYLYEGSPVSFSEYA